MRFQKVGLVEETSEPRIPTPCRMPPEVRGPLCRRRRTMPSTADFGSAPGSWIAANATLSALSSRIYSLHPDGIVVAAAGDRFQIPALRQSLLEPGFKFHCGFRRTLPVPRAEMTKDLRCSGRVFSHPARSRSNERPRRFMPEAGAAPHRRARGGASPSERSSSGSRRKGGRGSPMTSMALSRRRAAATHAIGRKDQPDGGLIIPETMSSLDMEKPEQFCGRTAALRQ